jgi:diketogulonate reductase-like aldo/keto reductase
VKYFQKHGCQITAYAPIGAGGYPGKTDETKILSVFEDPVIVELSLKYEKTPAQIILNWHIWRNVIVIPKTTKVGRLTENFDVYSLKMTEEDYEKISTMNKNARIFDPKFQNWYGQTPFYD